MILGRLRNREMSGIRFAKFRSVFVQWRGWEVGQVDSFLVVCN
jgi:hypothetical protein